MTRVTVIGSAGQLGTDLVRVLERAGGYRVFPLTHTDVECTDAQSVRRALLTVSPDIVINCASFVRVDDCEDYPEKAFQVNALGARNVAQVCGDLNVVCVYISTDYVFDGQKKTPCAEGDQPGPVNVYGASKLAGEYLVRASCPKYFVVRTAGLYGLAGSSGKGGNFVESMIRLAREGSPIRVVNDQILSPTYSADLAGMIERLIHTEAYGLYHVSNSGQCSWYQFADQIFALLSLRPNFGPTTTAAYGAKARRPAFSVLAQTALERLGLDRLRPWPEALRAYLHEKGHLRL